MSRASLTEARRRRFEHNIHRSVRHGRRPSRTPPGVYESLSLLSDLPAGSRRVRSKLAGEREARSFLKTVMHRSAGLYFALTARVTAKATNSLCELSSGLAQSAAMANPSDTGRIEVRRQRQRLR